VDASITADFDSLTIQGMAPLTGGSGSASSLTYQLWPASSFRQDFGKFGSTSLYLPRSSSSGFTVEGFSQMSFSGSWTIEFWFYQLSATLGMLMMTQDYKNSIQINTSASGIGLYINQDDTTLFSAIGLTAAIVLNEWNHIAVGYNDSLDKFFICLNGVYKDETNLQVGSLLDWSLIGTTFHFGSYPSIATSSVPGSVPFNGYIDEVRFSSTARYTASFTVPSAAFTSDPSTIFLHHCSGPVSGQETPTPITTDGVKVDASGNFMITGDISSQVGDISLTTGNIGTSRGSLSCYRDILTTSNSWRMGPSGVLSSASLSETATYGCYTVCGGWTSSAATSHNIRIELFVLNLSNKNIMGSFTIYAADKESGSRFGVLKGDYLLVGSTPSFYTISTTKSASLTTLSATVSSSALVVACNPACKVCWRFDGCV
jgi:hypothetical protein